MSVPNNFIPYNQKLTTINWRVDKQSLAQLYNGLLLSNEKEQSVDPFDIDKWLSNGSLGQKSICSVVQLIRNAKKMKQEELVSERRSVLPRARVKEGLILGGHLGTGKKGQNIQYLDWW